MAVVSTNIIPAIIAIALTDVVLSQTLTIALFPWESYIMLLVSVEHCSQV